MILSNKELAEGLGVPASRITEWTKRGMPRASIGEAASWRQVHARPRGRNSAPVVSLQPTAGLRENVASGKHDWESRLMRAREMELEIFESLKQALAKGDLLVIAKLQIAHVTSIKEIASAEAIALETRKASGELIHRDTVRAIWREILPPLKDEIERLPTVARAKCNPENPHVAYEALKVEINRILNRISNLKTKF